jgi:hypothetical protein
VVKTSFNSFEYLTGCVKNYEKHKICRENRGVHAPEYVQRIDLTPIQTTANGLGTPKVRRRRA